MLTSPWIIRLRGITRRLGLNRLAGALLAGHRYEDRFGPALQSEARPGETIWDIGANIGLYTQAFVASVGCSGRVVAFEPAPAPFGALRDRFAGVPQVRLMNIAMGSSDGCIYMSLDANPLAATHRVVNMEASGGGCAGRRAVRGFHCGRISRIVPKSGEDRCRGA